jgi:UDP-glucose 4-epimerase
MRHKLGRAGERVEFVVGDVRDEGRLLEVMHGMALVIYAAALKHVPACEESPYEAVLTNVVGAMNAKRAAVAAGVETAVFISTDKAVAPINVMGLTKALQERIALSPAVQKTAETRFVCVRYGNVIASRGSVIPLFQDCLRRGRPIPITHADMTRFLLTLDDAAAAILAAIESGVSGDVWVRRCPAARVVDIAAALAHLHGAPADYPHEIIGVRPGEKLHETLMTAQEMAMAETKGDYFVIPRYPGVEPIYEIREALRSDRVELLEPPAIEQVLLRAGVVLP